MKLGFRRLEVCKIEFGILYNAAYLLNPTSRIGKYRIYLVPLDVISKYVKFRAYTRLSLDIFLFLLPASVHISAIIFSLPFPSLRFGIYLPIQRPFSLFHLRMSSSLTLIPINLHNTPERTELLRQRILCGWDKTPQTLQTWREQVDAKTLHLFWIHSAQKEKVGHIASCTKPDILNLGKTVQHICNLFILPEHRGSGLASHAVRAMEEEAGRGGCAAMTLNALSRRYIEDGGKRVCFFFFLPLLSY